MTNTSALAREEREFLSVPEVSQFLGIAIVSVYRLVERRALPVYRVLRRLKFRRRDVLAWVEANRTPSSKDSVWPSAK